MKPPPFTYHSPKNLDDALGLLATLENAKVLAGGQSLVPMLNMRFAFPDHVVDLNKIPGLGGIDEKDGTIRIGALTRHREIERSDVLALRCPLFIEAIGHVAHVQVRNWGTIGGSLCHLDPAAELPVVARAVDATIHVQSTRGARTIKMADFPAFYMTPAIEPDEIVTAVTFTPWKARHGWGFAEFARRPGDFAVVSAAALVEMDAGVIARASLVLGGVAAGPVRCEEAEAILAGSAGTEKLAAAMGTCKGIDATEDAQASAAYRRHLAHTLATRAMQAALSRAGAVVE